MNIYISGINYKTTPLENREKLSFNEEQQKDALKAICSLDSIKECILLSTCNRTEVYVYSESECFEFDRIERALCDIKDINIYDYKKYFYSYSGRKAVRHLFKVASGLDSLVLGEDQILGQVKNAYALSLDMGTSSSVLNTLFREAITAAKKVKTYTELSKNSISTASLAVKLISETYEGQMTDKCAMVIGTGKIGTIALKYLVDIGVKKIYITNRTHGKAGVLSEIYNNVQPVEYKDRYNFLKDCDVVISSTSSPHYTITRDMVEHFATINKQRIFMDLAVPRDIDAEIKEIPGIVYYNIDDLQQAAERNIGKRMTEVMKAEEVINEYILEFERWYEFRNVLPVIKEIQKYADGILNERISRTLAKMKSANEEDKEVIKAAMNNTVNEILNKLVYSIRDYGNKEDIYAYFRCLGDILKE